MNFRIGGEFGTPWDDRDWGCSADGFCGLARTPPEPLASPRMRRSLPSAPATPTDADLAEAVIHEKMSPQAKEILFKERTPPGAKDALSPSKLADFPLV